MLGWFDEIFLKPWRLIRICRNQGIKGFTILGFQASHLAEVSAWKLVNSVEAHGKLFYVRFGKFVRLVVQDPAFVQELLAQNAEFYQKPSFITALGILGDGIFSSSGKGWNSQRKYLAKSFLMRELKEHFEAVKRLSSDELKSWNAMDKETVDIHKKFLTLTVKLICHIALGENIENASASAIYQAFDRYLQNSKRLICGPLFNYFGCSPKSKKILVDENRLKATVSEIVDRNQHMNQDAKDSGKRLVLNMMIDNAQEGSNAAFNPKLVIDNTATLLLAGHETTANLLTWTVYLLAKHPSWQECARNETKEAGDLDMKNLSQLKTLSMIFWESLRLFPPQPIIGRMSMQTNTVQGFVISEGMEVVVPIAAIHRSKDIWGEDSDDFRPDRFANGIGKACKNPSAFLPFGSGPRTCIGQSLALLEAKVIMYFMLNEYSWELSSDYCHHPDVTLTLQPKFGMPIVLSKLRGPEL